MVGRPIALNVVGKKWPHKESPLEREEGSQKEQVVVIWGHRPQRKVTWAAAGWGEACPGISQECP